MSQKRFINYTAKERGRSGISGNQIFITKHFINALDTEDFNGCDLFQDTRSKPVDEQAEESLEHSLLLEAMKDLEPKEKDIIRRIYCYDQSLRQISRETGVPVTTLHYRHGLKERCCTDSHRHFGQRAARADIQVPIHIPVGS